MWPSKRDKATQESGRQSKGVHVEVGPPAEERALACTCVGRASEARPRLAREHRDARENEQESEAERERERRQTSAGRDRDRRPVDATHVGQSLLRPCLFLSCLLLVLPLLLAMGDVLVPPEITAELTQILSNLVLGDSAIRTRQVLRSASILSLC